MIMSQYQKHHGNAISGQSEGYLCGALPRLMRSLWPSIGRIVGSTLLCAVIFLLNSPVALVAAPTSAAASNGALAAPPAHFIPLQQGAALQLTPPLVIPLESTVVHLLTHTADFTLSTADSSTGAASLTLQMDAIYRLENDSTAPTTLLLNVTEPESIGNLVELALTADGVPLTLFQTEGVGYSAQLQLQADARVTVALRYVVTVADLPLPLIAYRAMVLSAWRSNPSIRVSIGLPAGAGPDSWLHVAPEDWRYAQVADNALPGVKWLYDAQLPREPFLFEFFHPNQWQRLQELAAVAGTDPAFYLTLGDEYRNLTNAVPAIPEYEDVRTRFYSQALAAYTAGIDQLTTAGGGANEVGALYNALAALYRAEVARTDGSTDPAYAAAMVDAARQALAQLPTLDNRRIELTQWVADGLQVMLIDAQNRDAWPTALAIIEQLAALPPEMVNRDILERTKRSITVRQALQLMEEDNRPAALALAGDELLDDQLLPPPAEQPLFSRWEFSTTITPDVIEVMVQPMSTLARQGAAITELEQLINQLRIAADPGITLAWQPTVLTELATADAGDSAATDPPTTLANVGQLVISAPSDSSFASLTTAMPTTPKWLFLYTFLRQLQPVVETQRSWLTQATTVRLSLDLQPVATEWVQIATNLESVAAQLDGEAAGRNARDAVEAEQALRARIQAANYRAAAQDWRKVARDSWLLLQLNIPAGLQAPVRTWLLTVDSPAPVAELQSTPSYVASFIAVLLLGMTLLLLLSGLLWWLL